MEKREEIENIFAGIRKRFFEVNTLNPAQGKQMLDHLKSIARWNEDPMDYPVDTPPSFPETVDVAFYVCHPDCGAMGLLIEGGSQECQYCGGVTFRIESKKYRLAIL